jgi:hypothetical protein
MFRQEKCMAFIQALLVAILANCVTTISCDMARAGHGSQECLKISRAEGIPTALEVVTAYNIRPIGSPGIRRVRLEIWNDTQLSRAFTIRNAWRRLDNKNVQTVFLLDAPAGLAGTAYLLEENNGSIVAPISVSLFLPAGRRRVLSLDSARLDEGLLGSDFGYSHLVWLIPTDGVEFTMIGSVDVEGEPCWKIGARAGKSARLTSSHALTYYLHRERALLIGADYGDGETSVGEPSRRLRVESYRQVGSAWTPTRMRMESASGRSVLLLESIDELSVDHPALFQRENLPVLADRFGELDARGAER